MLTVNTHQTKGNTVLRLLGGVNMIRDLSGLRFGKLVAINVDHIKKCKGGSRVYWKCKCDCGNYKIVRNDCLTSGNTRSCGCMNTVDKQKPDSNRKHKLYRVYWSMKQRCFDEKSNHYDRYGGRGITMCEEWKNSYDEFYTWSIKNGYSEGLTIDRINNDGNYEPDNCRWITQAEQLNNISRNRNYEYNGKIQNISQWAREIGISVDTLYARLVKLNWPIEKALTLKPKK